MDITASIQQVTNKVVLKMAAFVRDKTKKENFVLQSVFMQIYEVEQRVRYY